MDFNRAGVATKYDVSHLGATLSIKPYITNGKIKFSGKLELVEAPDENTRKPTNMPTFLTSKKVFSGNTESGEQIAFDAFTPSGTKAKPLLTLVMIDWEGVTVKAKTSKD